MGLWGEFADLLNVCYPIFVIFLSMLFSWLLALASIANRILLWMCGVNPNRSLSSLKLGLTRSLILLLYTSFHLFNFFSFFKGFLPFIISFSPVKLFFLERKEMEKSISVISTPKLIFRLWYLLFAHFRLHMFNYSINSPFWNRLDGWCEGKENLNNSTIASCSCNLYRLLPIL